MTTSLDKVGQVESIQDYGRFIKTVEQAKTSRTDLFKGSSVCELKAPNANWSKTVLRGASASRVVGAGDLANGLKISDEANFSIKPMICLNSAMGGDGSMSFRKTGSIRITLRIARALAALYGPSVSTAGAGTVAKVALSTVILASNQNAGGLNNPLACEVLPNFKAVEFIYNNTINNSLVSYQITDYAELLERYVKSVSDSDHSSTSMWEIKHNNGMGIGLSFDGLLDLRRQRFQIQISSDVSSAQPYAISLFFWGVQTI